MKKLNVKLPQGGSKRALHSGMYASALAVVVLAVIILVNLVIRALPTKYTEYDISTTSLFTLSDTTENLLHELNADVTAYYLAESGQENSLLQRVFAAIREWLRRIGFERGEGLGQRRQHVGRTAAHQRHKGALLALGGQKRVLEFRGIEQNGQHRLSIAD